MAGQISAVINVLNEEKNIGGLVESLDWADEVVVVDDGSQDHTWESLAKLASKNDKVKIFKHKGVGFVEPARNFAISKATNEWVLILDADEKVPRSLAERLQELAAKTAQINYVRLPRKNIIFNHFMQESAWWPDYNIRFFKKGKVKWGNQIHRPPEVLGLGLDLSADEKYALIHQNYQTVSGFLARMNRYTDIQAQEIKKAGYSFYWKDLLQKPLNEFLSRFFANQGYKDGLHGLALSLLQAFSFLAVYLKLWEMESFKEEEIKLEELEKQADQSANAVNYWFRKSHQPKNLVKKLIERIKN